VASEKQTKAIVDLALPIREAGGRLFLTVTPESKVKYSVDQIRRSMVRLGIGNMRLDRIKAVIEQATSRPEEIGPVFTFFDPRKEKYIEVLVSEDESSAFVQVETFDALEITPDDIRFCLYKAGVVEGIDEEKLKMMVRDKVANTPVMAAKATEPIDGSDARIEYLVHVTHKPQPRILEDGSVDLKSYDLLVPIEEGQVLARKIRATDGTPGFTVRGRVIPAKRGKDVPFPRGKGTYVSEDGTELRASVSGSVMRDPRGNFIVERVYVVPKDVDYSTGNIDCAGEVRIKGDVLPGFSVTATGDIAIHGVIEGARVVSKNGSIMVKGGIHGKQHQAYVEAKKTVAARFIQEATVVAGENVMVSGHVLDSLVQAGKRVDVSSRKGQVINSLVRAGEEIVLRNLGAAKATKTDARIEDGSISPEEMKTRLGEIALMIAQLEEKLSAKAESLENVKASTALPVQSRMMKASLQKEIGKLQEKLNELKNEQARLKEIYARLCAGRVIVMDTAFQGARVSIAGLSEALTETVRRVEYYVDAGQLAVRPYDGTLSR